MELTLEMKIKESPFVRIIQRLSICNVCKCLVIISCAVALTLFLMSFRYSQGYGCKRLLTDGRLREDKWQPYGCMIHNFSQSDAGKCILSRSKTYIVFMGDSRIRELFYEFASMFTTNYKMRPNVYHRMSFKNVSLNLKIDYLWEPYVNRKMTNAFNNWYKTRATQRPDLVIVSDAAHSIWTIAYNEGNDAALQYHKSNLTNIVPIINKLKTTTKVIWRLQDPVEEDRLKGDKKRITNLWIDRYNSAVKTIIQNSAAIVWSSSRRVYQSFKNNPTRDGIHLARLPLYWDNQIIINMYCNNIVHTSDGTCCRDVGHA